MQLFARNSNQPPSSKREAGCLEKAVGVAIKMDRTKLFKVEVGSLSHSRFTQYVDKTAYKTHPAFSAMLYRSMNGYSSQMLR